MVAPLDEAAALELLAQLSEREVEAVAVALLWSTVNPAHEVRLGEMIEASLPGIPFTLSHLLNPTIREYRRASSAAIDASLKPLMSRFFGRLEARLREEGFGGRLLVMTSAGGVLDAAAVREAPIHSIGSGPAAAPVAGRHFAAADADSAQAIVTDAGGTTYDVSLIRDGQIPWTREAKVGSGEFGNLTGFPAVDARSIGAGGGSIASVDEEGLLRVGPQSASAKPGPACFGAGGTRPTVTDACLVLGWLDPEAFLGGKMALRADLARAAIAAGVGDPLGLEPEDAAAAILQLACEHMVGAIEEITLVQGVDPAASILVAGGGGGGLYSSAIARRLGCGLVVIPEVSPALSAAGTIFSDLQSDFSETFPTDTGAFDFDGVAAVLERLRARCEEFAPDPAGRTIDLSVEARYPQQVWEIEVPLPVERIATAADVEALRREFHRVHESIFAISDPGSEVELVQWRARARVQLATERQLPRLRPGAAAAAAERPVRFPDFGPTVATIHAATAMDPGATVAGPAIVESAFATVVVEPGGEVTMTPSGSLLLRV